MLRIVTYMVIGLLLLPMAVVLGTSFTAASFVSFPPQGFTLRWYAVALAKQEFVDSFVYSLVIAAITGVIATALGGLVAVVLVRFRFTGREALDAFFMSPLVLPTIVIGIGILQFFSQLGFKATSTVLIAGHVIITTPYAIRLIGASLTGVDPVLERAARNLGAAPLRAFAEITLPLIRPGVVAGAIFAFITSFDNVTISIFLATPRQVTLPVRIFNLWDQPLEPWLIAISAMVILFTVALIALIERTIGLSGLYGQPAK
ncbi:MAG: ABC transporter permease [Proteobacteria bacterium]|nr:ABC transporter permease [Pseudomonadota bacterium]